MKLAHLNRWHNRIAQAIIFGLLLTGFSLGNRSAVAGPNIWTNIGPTYLGASYNDDGSPNSVVASDAQGNLYLTNVSSADSSPTVVYRSGDGGATWQRLGDFAGVFPPPHLGLGFPNPYLAVSPNGNTMFISANRDGYSHHIALLRSDDRGATWQVVTRNLFFNQIIFNPTDSNRLYASGSAAANYNGIGKNLYRSTDGGSTWAALNQSGLIAIDPTNSQHIITSAEAVSTDGGDTWRKLPSSYSHDFVPVFLSPPGGSSTLLLIDSTTVSFSSDGGITKGKVNYAGEGVRRSLQIETVASSPGRVYLLARDTSSTVRFWHQANFFVYTSTDGFNWVEVRSPVLDDFENYYNYPIRKGLIVNQRHEEQLYYSGQYSHDGSQSWTRASGLPFERHQIRDLAIEGNTWMGITDRALYRSTDQGGNWQTMFISQYPNYVRDAYEATSVSYHKGNVFVNLFPPNVGEGPPGSYQTSPYLMQSTDAGNTWLSPTLNTNGYYTRLSFDDAESIIYVAATPAYKNEYDPNVRGYVGFSFEGGLYKSIDGGKTWFTLAPGMEVNNVLIDPRNSKHLWAAGDAGLTESSDGGVTWRKRVTNPQVGGLIFSDAGSSDVLYTYGAGGLVNPAASGGLKPYIVTGPLYKSTDGGSTWQKIHLSGAAPDNYIVTTFISGALAVVQGHLLVAWHLANSSDNHIAESTDGGSTWRALTGMGVTGVGKLIIDQAGGQLLNVGGQWLNPGYAGGLFGYTVQTAPGHAAFERVWQREDAPVVAGKVQRSWTWGQQQLATMREPLAGLVGGDRLVRYYDKSRMEINDPSADPSQQWYVTNGRLVVEMVSGKLQTGLTQTESRDAALINVAGDLDPANPAPTYASFYDVASFDGHPAPAPDRTGQVVSQSLDRGGQVGSSVPPSVTIKLAQFDTTTEHNIAAPLWDFLGRKETVLVNGQYITAPMYSNWVYVMGHPISEPYWVKMKVSGAERWVLVQLFERRTLTYTPSNAPAWQVEMGNVGLHYYIWRYGNGG